ncbi:molecular chaperone DnaJ [Rhodococcus koreensis]
MTQREWSERDFYADLGVPSNASVEQIRKAYRRLARELHPDANPQDPRAEDRFKAVSEAHAVLSDPIKRTEYDEARSLFTSGPVDRHGFPPGTGRSSGVRGDSSLGDLFARTSSFTGGGIGDLFNRAGDQGTGTRPRRGSDVETDTRLPFRAAIRGVVVPLRVSTTSTCTACHGSGATPGTTARECRRCHGMGLVTRNLGAFGFSEPCTDCRGSGSVIDTPCPNCQGTGIGNRTRTINARVPPGIRDGQRIRLPGRGEPGLRGAPAGDLYVNVHVITDPVFGRDGDDLTVTVPVTFGELALGATISIPTLDGHVGMKIPAGTAAGRTFRIRGRGVHPPGGTTGDLLVRTEVTVPAKLDAAATEALRAYAQAEKAAGFDPRAGWAGTR